VISKGSPVVYCGKKFIVEKTYGKGEFLVWSGKKRCCMVRVVSMRKVVSDEQKMKKRVEEEAGGVVQEVDYRGVVLRIERTICNFERGQCC